MAGAISRKRMIERFAGKYHVNLRFCVTGGESEENTGGNGTGPGIKQPTVAGMEKPGRDVKLSTLGRYVDAIGGKLNIDVELPDGTHYMFRV